MFEPVYGNHLVGNIQTVSGPISNNDLGITLMHEHILLDQQARERRSLKVRAKKDNFFSKGVPSTFLNDWDKKKLNIDNLSDSMSNRYSIADNYYLNDLNLAQMELNNYFSRGGDSVVDLTVRGIGRDPLGLFQISSLTGINIIMGTGWYVPDFHPVDMDSRTIDSLVEELVKEICVGVDSTFIRAGIIGEIGIQDGKLTENEIKIVKAVSRASISTGTSISFHYGGTGRERFNLLDIIKNEGCPVDRIILGHSDLIAGDLDLILELLENGIYIQFDLLGRVGAHLTLEPIDSSNPWPSYLNTSNTALVSKVLPTLISYGYVDKILLSQDICTKIQLKKFGGTGYSFILESLVPHLLEIGISKEDIETILVKNPRDVLKIKEFNLNLLSKYIQC
ncbi:MAG: hypothetical protein FI687_02365 [SAR202 cluster bacterium]|nr:hypothetical protein [SAR202 cluster bacterium]|tara:strand:+ start:20609 stop:21790 length:1182 start_codon:yes stop_codon:yes gene_type:complete